jgi:hypothetical protein
MTAPMNTPGNVAAHSAKTDNTQLHESLRLRTRDANPGVLKSFGSS